MYFWTKLKQIESNFQAGQLAMLETQTRAISFPRGGFTTSENCFPPVQSPLECSSFLSSSDRDSSAALRTACSIVTSGGEPLVEGDQIANWGGSFIRLKFPRFSQPRKALISAQKSPFQFNLNLFLTRKLLPGILQSPAAVDSNSSLKLNLPMTHG